MKKIAITKKNAALAAAAVVGGAALAWVSAATPPQAAEPAAEARQKAMLTVTASRPQSGQWPVALSANGGIFAWQEAVIGSELSGLRLAEVGVNVGDHVKAGQILARFDPATVAADVEQKEAALEEARSALAEAQSNVARTEPLAASGLVSAQQMTQYTTAARSGKARVASAQAALRSAQVRLRQTEVRAPDDGVISVRSATLGSVAPQGQELFRLIRQNRLEWRAEVPGSDLRRIKPGQAVTLIVAGGASLAGKVRMVGPTLDPNTRNGLVYIDLPVSPEVQAGLFARGQFEIGQAPALTVQQSAVVMRDGYGYVFKVDKDEKVSQTRVSLGRRVGERVELLAGVGADALLVDQGAGFLADGDVVKVAAGSAAPGRARPGSPEPVESEPKLARASTISR
ncbi:MAG: efflux RND transporter periplasmic adaptor subunit [Duganella sp.]